VNKEDITIPKGASSVSWLDPDHRIDFTIVLSAKAPLPSVHSEPSKKHLTHAALHKAHGPHDNAIQLIASFAKKFNLTIIEEAAHRRTVQLSGRSADICRAFKTRLEKFDTQGHEFFFPVQPLTPPPEWEGIVEAVIGIHNSRQSWPRRQTPMMGHSGSVCFHDLAKAYAFPPTLNGKGQTIGLIEFGGGFREGDIQQFCAHLKVPTPQIAVVNVGDGKNQPASLKSVHQFLDVISGSVALAAGEQDKASFIAAQCTAEVTMDIEIAAALAPESRIVVYFAAVDKQGLYHALNYAVHDEHNRPDVISVSWSVPEQSLSRSEIESIEGVLREAAALGITVCASSGDAGALNGSTDGKPSVNYPASSPYCLACGGTSGKMNLEGISDEVVWNAMHYGIHGASGGGVSEKFQVPAWQAAARVPVGPAGKAGRGVPDVAGLADPRHGCELLLAGRSFASAGTSAVAPMWAALVARLNQALGKRCGHLHPHIYEIGEKRRAALRPVLKGNNGVYHAGEGWNACTGYGTPRGDELLAHLKKRFT
jgi:kumamolisin